jgi:hypothetical protein
VPEEGLGTPTGGTHIEAQERLEKRLDRIELEILRENRWWRGGLIAALVLMALAILVAGRHRRPHGMEPMGPAGWGQRMPYGQFDAYPPPWAFSGRRGPGGCGCPGGYDDGRGRGFRPGSGPEAGPR